MDLTMRTEVFQNEDQSWLRSGHGTDATRSITLKVSAFTAGTHYPNGYFPSGTAVGLYTSGPNTGLYGPYTAGATDGTENLAGFVFTATKSPAVNTTNVQAALLDRGAVLVSKLPAPWNTAINSTAQATNPRFTYA